MQTSKFTPELLQKTVFRIYPVASFTLVKPSDHSKVHFLPASLVYPYLFSLCSPISCSIPAPQPPSSPLKSLLFVNCTQLARSSAPLSSQL
ncbi:hypothetical protein L596_011679 [Steinernema carpocapsae]|uniref:Uncharacterized protein n=1 Tax=Steinernema carpocapsae TaxID=34508 RepID=A0A4U5NVL2_STECR|nr:hypothetical protein L596_011679 [Steinernema carpocapsae]